MPQSSANRPSDTEPLWASITKGSPADIVEVKAILVVNAFSTLEPGGSKQKAQELAKEKIDWWLEQGGDEKCYSVEAGRRSSLRAAEGSVVQGPGRQVVGMAFGRQKCPTG